MTRNRAAEYMRDTPPPVPPPPSGYDVDVCTCTHRRNVHADRFAPGHGQCLQSGCRCVQFTWAGRVTS